jgi:hypothetical protein
VIRYAATNQKIEGAKASPHGWDIVMVPSDSNPSKFYTIDITHGRCSCPAWIHQKGGQRYPCKHLQRLGFKYLIQSGDVEVSQPKSKAKVGQKVKVHS